MVKKKINKTKLKDRMDIVWAKIIKYRAGWVCEITGKDTAECQLQSHHIVGKGCTYLRWDLRNGISLWSQRHRLGNPSAHNNPIWFVEKLKAIRLEDYEYLKPLESKLMSSIPLEWYLEKYEWLKTELKKYDKAI